MVVQRTIDINSEEYKLGERLRHWRKLRGLSQTGLSKIVGIERAAISRYENGSNGEMGFTTLKKFCEALQVSSDDLLGIRNSTTDRNFTALNGQMEEMIKQMQNMKKIVDEIQGKKMD